MYLINDDLSSYFTTWSPCYSPHGAESSPASSTANVQHLISLHQRRLRFFCAIQHAVRQGEAGDRIAYALWASGGIFLFESFLDVSCDLLAISASYRSMQNQCSLAYKPLRETQICIAIGKRYKPDQLSCILQYSKLELYYRLATATTTVLIALFFLVANH
ncbi:hypothetical protein BT96DRAFT_344750 [Gymnopus androsaceus JB14]|uniref:Uncharacterized protein n=1 Tax=Gymnopus androsaceus JB14 TaxID=1447944 RepID=A0A6A4GZ80_9AGAR|nr:hypothetical protein BT96DRAFT_344750 [Gymnopus androsaceus JB14]